MKLQKRQHGRPKTGNISVFKVLKSFYISIIIFYSNYIPRCVLVYTGFGLVAPCPPQTTRENNNSKTNVENSIKYILVCRWSLFSGDIVMLHWEVKFWAFTYNCHFLWNRKSKTEQICCTCRDTVCIKSLQIWFWSHMTLKT